MTKLAKPHIVIISPALAKANNGNWQTADRWARFLRCAYRVTLCATPDASQPLGGQFGVPDLIIALHARRSAAAIATFKQRFPDTPVLLVLTGTDLYRDIQTDEHAKNALREATHLVVLQDAAPEELGADLRAKTTVIYQSAPTLKPVNRQTRPRYFDVVMIGHLRDEKDPATFMRAAALVTAPNIRFKHLGGALDPALGAQAQATQRDHNRYQWLGNMGHAETRQILKRSQLMVITSRMEGGANVIIEAVTSGVPVLASDISGNVGMLGRDYAGYFPLGDSAALAALIDRAAADSSYYQQLTKQCTARVARFAPEHEKAAVLHLADNLINPSSQRIAMHHNN